MFQKTVSTAILFVLVVLFSSPASSEGISTEAYVTAKNAYVAGNMLVMSPSAVVQGGVTFRKDGDYLELWFSEPVHKNSENEFGKEQDVTLGKVSDLGPVRLTSSLALFNMRPTSKIGRGDILQVAFEVTPVSPLLVRSVEVSPFAKVEVVDSPGFGLSWDPAYFVGVRASMKLSESVNAGVQLDASYRDTCGGIPKGTVLHAKLSFAWNVEHGNFAVIPFLERYQGYFAKNDSRINNNVWGVTLSKSF